MVCWPSLMLHVDISEQLQNKSKRMLRAHVTRNASKSFWETESLLKRSLIHLPQCLFSRNHDVTLAWQIYCIHQDIEALEQGLTHFGRFISSFLGFKKNCNAKGDCFKLIWDCDCFLWKVTSQFILFYFLASSALKVCVFWLPAIVAMSLKLNKFMLSHYQQIWACATWETIIKFPLISPSCVICEWICFRSIEPISCLENSIMEILELETVSSGKIVNLYWALSTLLTRGK